MLGDDAGSAFLTGWTSTAKQISTCFNSNRMQHSSKRTMNQNDQLTSMIEDIRQIITKYTNDTTDSTVTLEKDEKTGKIQVIIRIKNISEMKISFR